MLSRKSIQNIMTISLLTVNSIHIVRQNAPPGASPFSWAISMPTFSPPVTSAQDPIAEIPWIYSSCQTDSDSATYMEVGEAVGLGG